LAKHGYTQAFGSFPANAQYLTQIQRALDVYSPNHQVQQKIATKTAYSVFYRVWLKLESQKIGFQTDAKCICCSEHQVLAQVLAQDYADLNGSHKLVKIRELTVERFLEQKKDKNVTVVDVRSTDERDQIHYEGMHIPLDELEARAFELQKDHTIICYCESGKRSLKAVGKLSELGFNAKSIKGGLNKLLNTK